MVGGGGGGSRVCMTAVKDLMVFFKASKPAENAGGFICEHRWRLSEQASIC